MSVLRHATSFASLKCTSEDKILSGIKFKHAQARRAYLSIFIADGLSCLQGHQLQAAFKPIFTLGLSASHLENKFALLALPLAEEIPPGG